MDQTNAMAKRHMKSFWPLVIIFVIAAVLGGAIYWLNFNLSVDYDLQSIVLSVHRKTQTSPEPVKNVKNPSATPSTSLTK